MSEQFVKAAFCLIVPLAFIAWIVGQIWDQYVRMSH